MHHMELLRPSLICIYLSLLFQYVICEGMPGSPATRLTCMCALSSTGIANNFPPSTCSTSCNCTIVMGTGNKETWSCSCDSTVPSKLSSVHVENCFTSCNCTSGLSGAFTASGTTAKQHIPGKLLVILLSVGLATITILCLLAYYFYSKDRSFLHSATFSSENSISWNSSSNLLSQPAGTSPEYQVKKASGLNFFSRYINMTSCFFSNRTSFIGTAVQFSFLELEHATNKFSDENLLGIGGSSKVYRGHIRDGRVVAIKRLNSLLGSHADYEFLSEVEIMSRLHHRSVVPLLGYCLELHGKYMERLLVFEFLSRGSLRDHLDASHSQEILEWETRVSIALGVAKGLEYLHEAIVPNVLHRDIKSTNILLDDKWRPKITDLGMAKRLSTDDHVNCASSPARMMGTFGYFAPEYAILGRASLKSDVFSFGVVLLELVTGRKPIHKSSKKSEESLVLWAMPYLHDRVLVMANLPDPLLKGNFPKEEMQIMSYLAKECLQWDPESRPSMSEVVQILCAISPDKTKHRDFHVHLFSELQQGTNGIRDTERQEASTVLTTRVEMGEVNSLSTWEENHRHILLSGEDLVNCTHGENGSTVLPSQKMEKQILMTPCPERSRAGFDDDEVVDLTEPRFESFTQKPFP